MEAKAIARYVRVSPTKVRIVIDLIRGKSVGEAISILKHTPKIGSEVVLKVLNSAISNAVNNSNMIADRLVVSAVYVDQGPTMKRIHPRSRGQAFKILKRSCHVTVAVAEKA